MNVAVSTDKAADCRPYIGQVVTIAVAYEKKDDNCEVVVSGVLTGVVDLYKKDGSSLHVSTWTFKDNVGNVQIDWQGVRVSGTYVDKIVAVEFSTYDQKEKQ